MTTDTKIIANGQGALPCICIDMFYRLVGGRLNPAERGENPLFFTSDSLIPARYQPPAIPTPVALFPAESHEIFRRTLVDCETRNCTPAATALPF